MARATRPRSPSTRSIASGGPLGLAASLGRPSSCRAIPSSWRCRGPRRERSCGGACIRGCRRIVPWFSVSHRKEPDPGLGTFPGPGSGSCRCAPENQGTSRRQPRLQAPRHDLSLRGPRHRHEEEIARQLECFPRHAAASREFRKIRSTSSRANVAWSISTSSDRSNGSTYGDVSSRRQPDRFRDWRHRQFDAPRWQAGFVVQTTEAPPGSYQVDATCPRCRRSPRPTNGRSGACSSNPSAATKTSWSPPRKPLRRTSTRQTRTQTLQMASNPARSTSLKEIAIQPLLAINRAS